METNAFTTTARADTPLGLDSAKPMDVPVPSEILDDDDETMMTEVTQVTVMDDDPSLPVVTTSLDAKTELQIQNFIAQDSNDEPVAKRWRFETPDGQIAYMVLNISESFDNADSLNFSLEDKFHPESQTITRVAGEPTDITQAWLTTKNDKDAAAEKGQRWKQGQWSNEEVEILQNNINTYCKKIADPAEIIFEMSKDERKDFYRIVAKGLQRPLFAVYRRVIRMYDQKNHIGKYTREETQQLKELKKLYGSDWSAIGTAIGRSAASVKDKSRLIRDACNSGKWTSEEENLLGDTVRELTKTNRGEDITTGISWSAVAERVGTRSEKQCRTKWLNYLNWKLKGGKEWTKTDELKLIEILMEKSISEESDVDWVSLCKVFKSARSPQWLRGKWWSMKKNIAEYQAKSLPDILISLRNSYMSEAERRRMHEELTRMRLAKQRDARLSVPTLSQLEQHLVGANEVGSDLEIETTEIDGLTYQILPQETQHSARTGAYLVARADRSGVQMPSTIELDGQEYIIEQLPGQPVMTIMANQEELAKLLIRENSGSDASSEVTIFASSDEQGAIMRDCPDVGDRYLIDGDVVGIDKDHTDDVITVLTDRGASSSVPCDRTAASRLLDYGSSDGVDGRSKSLSHPVIDEEGRSECLGHDGSAEYHSAVLTEHVVKADLTTSGFPQLSSSSDPMLPTDNPDLMASSSDIENDKTNNPDDS